MLQGGEIGPLTIFLAVSDATSNPADWGIGPGYSMAEKVPQLGNIAGLYYP
jgi:hypothetical protein